MTARARLLGLGVVLLIMLDTFRRIFSDSRPVDDVMLVIEFLVLVLIAIEFGRSFLSARRVKQRLSVLRGVLQDGMKLHDQPPRGVGVNQGVVDWQASVKEWIEHTHALLKSYSEHAAVAFLMSDTEQHGIYPNIADYQTYVLLRSRLRNLRDIMANPAVYLA